MDQPPWLEVITDEYHHRTLTDLSGSAPWIEQERRAYALIQGQLDGHYRIRLVLREDVDLRRGPKANPHWLFSYDVGHHAMQTCADEVVIQYRDGRRAVVPIPGRGDDLTKPGWCWANGRIG